MILRPEQILLLWESTAAKQRTDKIFMQKASSIHVYITETPGLIVSTLGQEKSEQTAVHLCRWSLYHWKAHQGEQRQSPLTSLFTNQHLNFHLLHLTPQVLCYHHTAVTCLEMLVSVTVSKKVRHISSRKKTGEGKKRRWGEEGGGREGFCWYTLVNLCLNCSSVRKICWFS